MTEGTQVIKLAIEELQAANEKNGFTFNSMHEAYAVLAEEIEEAADEMITVLESSYKLWSLGVRKDNEIEFVRYANEINDHSMKLIQEAIQVLAMSMKALSTGKK